VRPYPSEENLEKRKQEVTAFRGKVEGLQNALQEFRPESLEKISPSEFQNRLVAKSDALIALFDEKGLAYPEQFAMGFERYRDELANPDATAKLNYQLEAADWLFRELAKVKCYSLRNVVREALPSETGRDWLPETRGPEPLYQSLPMEIVFLAEEEALNEFLNSISSSQEYFFAIDMIRISSEVQAPPVRGQAGLEEAEKSEESDGGGDFGGSDFGDFNFGGEEEAEETEETATEGEETEEEAAPPAAPVDTGRILGQVLGNEAVYAAVQFRLLIFTEPAEIPEFN
jgi:hypothetical protein